MKNVFHFFPTPLFCRIFHFLFSLPLNSRSLFFFPRTTHVTLAHPIAHTSSPYPPLPSPPTVALASCPKPLKTQPCTLEFSFCFFSQALLSRVWRPHKTFFPRSTWDRCPPDPLTPLPCISCLTLRPFPPRHTRLDCTFLREFLLGHGLGSKKVPFRLPLPCCVVCALPLPPPNPPAPTMPLLPYSSPLKILLRTLTISFFPLCLGFAAIIFWVPKGPQAPSEVQQMPQLPLYPHALHVSPNVFSFCFASHPPGLHVFFCFFWRGFA